MRFASRWCVSLLLAVLWGSSSPQSQTLAAVHQQRYCMGTMFDILAYHPSRAEAEQAVDGAMREIVRLDQVMSSFKTESDLSRLNREGRRGFVPVESSLYEVIEKSLSVSRRSGGTFDVTIAPLLRTWKQAQLAGRMPATEEIAAARKCVGYEQIETMAPNRIRFRSDCVEIDLGGIGKGYAVDRAIAVLASAGVQRALVNGGGSSIAARGAPPGQQGWRVQIGPNAASQTLLLRDSTVSTSHQAAVPFSFAAGTAGEILDPRSGNPSEARMAVSVVARSATVGDALSTALVVLSVPEADRLLDQYEDVSALWVSDTGTPTRAYGASRLQLSAARP